MRDLISRYGLEIKDLPTPDELILRYGLLSARRAQHGGYCDDGREQYFLHPNLPRSILVGLRR
jgi:hypothetical protein